MFKKAKQEEEKPVSRFRVLTVEQLKQLRAAIERDGGEEQFLIKKGAIKVNQYGYWVIMKYDDVFGLEIIPYVELRTFLNQLADYEMRIHEAEERGLNLSKRTWSVETNKIRAEIRAKFNLSPIEESTPSKEVQTA